MAQTLRHICARKSPPPPLLLPYSLLAQLVDRKQVRNPAPEALSAPVHLLNNGACRVWFSHLSEFPRGLMLLLSASSLSEEEGGVPYPLGLFPWTVLLGQLLASESSVVLLRACGRRPCFPLLGSGPRAPQSSNKRALLFRKGRPPPGGPRGLTSGPWA